MLSAKDLATLTQAARSAPPDVSVVEEHEISSLLSALKRAAGEGRDNLVLLEVADVSSDRDDYRESYLATGPLKHSRVVRGREELFFCDDDADKFIAQLTPRMPGVRITRKRSVASVVFRASWSDAIHAMNAGAPRV